MLMGCALCIYTDLLTVPLFVGLSHILRFPEQKCGTVPHFGNYSNGKFHTKNNSKTIQVSHLSLQHVVIIIDVYPRA